ncbi:carboxypeptidase regulatory-like domain-containing protein [Meiothermus sp.]|uniref:carboxypeptidase regulatory-like domain-containing protein n=1 Tax=Meiothermus sp. TaxID=1955249 RepID=UPI0021DD84BB|nr:carboxypeptidase regulatory-like domain-containing protein [Meiothermus sp.]GIW35405.1 MAG: hypothetical protein KatS3mg072_2738 [Meiothermus sp.]
MKRLFWLLSMSLIPLLTACPGGGGGTTPTLTVSPTTATLTAGTGNQTFNATLSNATGTINWALSPNVGTLSATTGTSVTYTPPATVASSTAVQLTATSGTLTATANITVNPPATINVSGTVIGTYLQPVASVPVVITSGGASFSTTTNASGVFSVSGVTPPYDATVVFEKTALIYKGLTRTDPTLVFLGVNQNQGAFRKASLSGTVSGGAGFPQPANHVTKTAFGSPEALDSATANTATGAYDMGTVEWFGPTTTTGNIHALQWQFDGTGLPTDYKGYGERLNVALSDGGSFASQNVTMSGVSEATISGSVTLPAGYNLALKYMAVGFADRSLIEVLDDFGSSTNFTYTTPNITGATILMRITAQNAAGTSVITTRPGLAVNATGVSISLPAGSDLSLPPNAATNVNNSTTFSYTPFSGGYTL